MSLEKYFSSGPVTKNASRDEFDLQVCAKNKKAQEYRRNQESCRPFTWSRWIPRIPIFRSGSVMSEKQVDRKNVPTGNHQDIGVLRLPTLSANHLSDAELR